VFDLLLLVFVPLTTAAVLVEFGERIKCCCYVYPVNGVFVVLQKLDESGRLLAVANSAQKILGFMRTAYCC
jgi:hypothetical protein